MNGLPHRTAPHRTAPHRTAPHRTAPLFVCLALWFASPAVRAQSCAGGWNAGFSMSLVTDHESEAVTYGWTAVTECFTFTFDHYAICKNDGASGSSPSAPTSGSGANCEKIYTRTTTSYDELLRSDRDYAARIFACMNGPCTQYYGDGSHGSTVTNDADGVTTEPEEWVLVGFEDYAGSAWVVEPAVFAPAAVFYPTGWTDAGKLGLWYGDFDGSGKNIIVYKWTNSAGWVDFTNSSNWTSPTTVAQESNNGDWYHAINPWVVPAIDGSTRYIRMFLQVGAAAGSYNIRSIDSTNENGSAFGLLCSSSPTCSVSGGGTCALSKLCNYDAATTYGGFCTDVTSATCFYLDHASHGRIGWNSVDDGPVDFGSDEPFMLFTGIGDTSPCDDAPDDVYEATWDPSGSGSWSVDYTSYPDPNCPVYEFQNGHDPYILPRADGSFKAYYNEPPESGGDPIVCYSQSGAPGTWEDCVEIVIGFDDGDPSGLSSCLGDTEMFAYESGGTRYEGGFSMTQFNDMETGDARCFEDGSGGNKDGMVFIQHDN